MFKLFNILMVVFLAGSFFIGCENATDPVSGLDNSSIQQSEGNSNMEQPEFPVELADAAAQRLAAIRSDLAKEFNIPEDIKNKNNSIDYDNSHYYYTWYPGIGYLWPVYSYDYDYTDGGTPAEVQFQQMYIEFWQWYGDYDDNYSVVIPMSEDDFNSLTIDAYAVSYSYVDDDAVTGLSGLKVDIPDMPWYYPYYYGYTWTWGYISVYRYTRGTDNFYPQFVESNFGIDNAGDGSQIGPYFSFVPTPIWDLSGSTYYDVNGNGERDGSEFGIEGLTVSLSGVGSTTTDANGDYSFFGVDEDDYSVSVNSIDGFISTTGLSSDIELDEDSSFDFGYELDFDALTGDSGDSYGKGWWKTNISKALQGRNRGVQIDAATLESHRGMLETFGNAPLNFVSLGDAHDALSYRGGNAANRLAQHLTASEYNFANGSYLNGDAFVTWAFVIWGEYLVENAGDFGNGDLNAAKDLFEGYNEGEIE